MRLRLFNPAVLAFLVGVGVVALVFALAANPSRPDTTRVGTTPIPTVILTITPIISPTIVATIPVPSPVGTHYPTVVPPTVLRTPTVAPPLQTATMQAFRTALTEEYGPPIPNPNEAEMLAETTLFQDLFTRPATVIAQGTNTVPTGPMGLLTYRVEEITLPGPTTFTRITVGRTITVDKVWRVTITGGTFPYGGELFDISLIVNGGYHQLPALRGAGEVRFLVFDRALLVEGATLGVSEVPFYRVSQSTLPETLHFMP